LNGWLDLAYVPSALANEGKISDSRMKKARLPSFPSARWSEFAPSFGLPSDLWRAHFDNFSIATVFLPLSFHKTTAKAAWHIQDVFQERIAQDRDEAGARARGFDAVSPLLVEFVSRPHIAPSTLSQLWGYSKAALSICRSA